MPSEVSWTEECSIGVLRLDTEHRYLLDLINQVIAVVGKGQDSDDTMMLWQIQFMQYAAIHFSNEEKIMDRYLADWHLREEHIHAHQKYWDLVAAISAESDRDNFIAFLKDWWLGHIQGIDRVMGRELLDRGVSDFDVEMIR